MLRATTLRLQQALKGNRLSSSSSFLRRFRTFTWTSDLLGSGMLSRNTVRFYATSLSRQQLSLRSDIAASRTATQTRRKSSSAVPAKKNGPVASKKLKGSTLSSPKKIALLSRPESDGYQERDSTFRSWALAMNKIASFAVIPGITRLWVHVLKTNLLRPLRT